MASPYFYGPKEHLPLLDTNRQALESLSTNFPTDQLVITQLHGPGPEALLNSNFITDTMMSVLEKDHPALLAALNRLVTELKTGESTPQQAWSMAASAGFTYKPVYALKPSVTAYTGDDRTKMFETLSRSPNYWKASCPFISIPATYSGLVGQGSQLSIALAKFGIGINITEYEKLRKQQGRQAQQRVSKFNAYNQKVGYNYLSRGSQGFYTSVNIGSVARDHTTGPGLMPTPTAENFGSRLAALAAMHADGSAMPWIELLRFTTQRYANPISLSALPNEGPGTDDLWGHEENVLEVEWTDAEIDEAFQQLQPIPYGNEKRFKRVQKFRNFLNRIRDLIPGKAGNLLDGVDWIAQKIEQKNKPTIGSEEMSELYQSAVQMSLPQVVEMVLSNTWDRYAEQYAVMMFSPFSASVKGTRIPMMKPLATTTEMQYTDLGSFTIAQDYEGLLFTSFTAVWNAPWILFTKLPVGWQNSPVISAAEMALNNQYISATSEEPGIDFQPIRLRDQLIPLFETGVSTPAQIRDVYDSTVYASPNTADSFRKTFTKLRVVGAGYRLFKTSASQNESGLIKQIAMPQGRSAIKNATELLNYPQDDDLHQRVYVASRGNDRVMGTTGFLSQLNYQPNDVNDTENFYRPEYRNTAQASDLGNGDQISLRYCGPIRQVIRFTTPPDDYEGATWQPNQYYLLSDFIREAISASVTPVVMDGLWLAGSSIDQPHLSVSNFEGVNGTVTFELQMIQHFEGTPTSKSQFLETGFALLDIKFATAMDIIRQFSFDRYFEGDQLVNSYDEEVKVMDYADAAQISSTLDRPDCVRGESSYTRALSRLKAPSTRTHDLLGRVFVTAGAIDPKHLDHIKPNDETTSALRMFVGPLLDSIARHMGISMDTRKSLQAIQGEVGREVARHITRDVTGVFTQK